MTSPLVVLVAVPVLAALVPIGFGVWWLAAPASRPMLVARYPLPVLTWIIALPFTLLAGAGMLFGLSIAADGGAPGFVDGTRPSTLTQILESYLVPVLGLLGLVLGAIVIVMGHLRPRRGPWPRFAMLAVAAVPILVLAYGAVTMTFSSEPIFGVAIAVVVLGSTVNALLAGATQAARQERRNAAANGASAALAPPPSPPASPEPPPLN